VASATGDHCSVGVCETLVAAFAGDCGTGAVCGQPTEKALTFESSVQLLANFATTFQAYAPGGTALTVQVVAAPPALQTVAALPMVWPARTS